MVRSKHSSYWIVAVWYYGRRVAERTLHHDAELSLGEGGDLVIPGVPGRCRFLFGGKIETVPGLRRLQPESGDDGRGLRFCVEDHPYVELTVEAERLQPNPFRKGLLRPPTRELAYGFALAGCLASFIAVDVAVSPDRPHDEQAAQMELEPSELVLAMYDVVPPPRSKFSPIEGYAAAGPDKDDAEPPEPTEDDEVDALPAEDELVQETDEPAPRPQEIRDEARPGELEPEGAEDVVKILGTTGRGGGGSSFGVLGALEPTDSDVVWGGIVGEEITATLDVAVVKEPDPVLALGDAPPAGMTRGPARELITETPAKGDPEGEAARVPDRECEMQFKPKPQVDIVFVLDVSDGMGLSLTTLSKQMAALDAEVRKYDAQPHYGAVVFVDQVEVIDAGKPTSSVARLDQSLFPFIAAADSNLQPDFETPNSEDAENGLDALHAAATQFEWRDPVDALHLVVYLGDGPIAGRGQALGSVTVQHGYAAVAEAMDDAEARVVGFTPSGTRGFRRAWSDEATLPEQTGGTAFSLQRFEDGRLSLRTALADLLKNPVCERPLL